MVELNPFAAGRFRLSVGTRPLDPSGWLVSDKCRDAQLARKAELLAERHAAVVSADRGSELAGAELLAAVRDVVGPGAGDHSPAWAGLHPVDLAGRLVQEDLCLLEDRGAGPVLTAASVCFPNRWRLADKMGRPLRQIHAPVPGFTGRIAAATDKVLARLRPGAPVWRLNWSLLDDPELFQPEGRPAAGTLAPADVGERIHLRTERQTLRRLPGSGAIVFTIHTTVRALKDLAGRSDVLESMETTLETLPADMLAYKGLAGSRDTILAWIGGVMSPPTPAPAPARPTV